MSPVAVNGVDNQGVSVNGVQIKQALSAASETVSKGVYDATTLSAVDADLHADKILLNEVIFGFTGTVTEGALAEDVEGDQDFTTTTDTAQAAFKRTINLDADEELVIASKTLTFDASSLAFAVAYSCHAGFWIDLRLYMGGVLMQTSTGNAVQLNMICRDFKALSGEQTCQAVVHNRDSGANDVLWHGKSSGAECPGMVAVGSVKLA